MVKRVLRIEAPVRGELGELNGAKVVGDNNVDVLLALLATSSAVALCRSSLVSRKRGTGSTEESREDDGDSGAVEMSSSTFEGGSVSMESSCIRSS